LGGVEGIYQIEFSNADCIRSGIVKRVLERYEEQEKIELGEVNPTAIIVDYAPIDEEVFIEISEN
jgi:phosphate starvation-inducible protein PhoH